MPPVHKIRSYVVFRWGEGGPRCDELLKSLVYHYFTHGVVHCLWRDGETVKGVALKWTLGDWGDCRVLNINTDKNMEEE